ncbi:hypothetical protein [Microbispora hainanensis]|uniref:Uncharacterized protein n=1 Tax=Microbispora hainanensis TaxID=568844 RepID=A0A544Y187_9ACTN|nr:hypothetical protein [Microbispora hainanensis]TQS10526.1 hypothetical protein FLX08_38120 [Microbispora hainanensis]
MAMGELISHLVQGADTETGAWMLIDEAAATGEQAAPWEQSWPGQGPDWLTIGPNALLCDTPRDFTPYIRLELWSDQPAAPEPAWEHSWTDEIFFRSGKIHLLDYFDPCIDSRLPFLDLGHQNATWLVRAQHKTLENNQETDFPSYIYRAEIYKFQFWRPIPQDSP